MNFDEYERTYEALYREFAQIVRDLLEKAIDHSEGVPRPQSVQCRGKEASHLRPKLEARGLLDCPTIETEIKDLAGVRLIFYTNTDVDQFLNSRLIPENFEVHWDETRIHHPTEENANRRYQAIHYTVSLNEPRSELVEYAKFKGLRCEIQIQTILIHAWAETSHDITYKRYGNEGFGGRAMASIEARLNKIMDEYLVPAGYEFQKVQHDFQRLMQGKALFDRGALDALDACTNNNERHEILTSLHEYVLPNYDDIRAVFPDVQAALMRAVDAAIVAETLPITTPFGDLPGKTPSDVVSLIVRIMCDLRYLNVAEVFQALAHIYQATDEAQPRKDVEKCVSELASPDLHVWQQVGPAVQVELVEAIDGLGGERREALWPLLHVVWRECLDTELRGTTWAADSMTLHMGAVPVVDGLRTVRDKAIAGLFEFYDRLPGVDDKQAVVNSLLHAMHLPTQATYSNELVAVVMDDMKRIIDRLTARVADMPYEIIEHFEHRLLYQHRRVLQIAQAPDDQFGCAGLAKAIAGSIIQFRDIANEDACFVRYKMLVGFETVIPAQWDDKKADFSAVEQYRRERIAEYVDALSNENEDEWYATIERCAATKSNDMATFPLFGGFLTLLAKRCPDIAERYLLRANDDVLQFLAAFLKGMHESDDRAIYERTIACYLEAGTHLAPLAREWRLSGANDETVLTEIVTKAMSGDDDSAVMECVIAVITCHADNLQPFLTRCFAPALQYLTAKEDPRWIKGVWFMDEAKTFFSQLSKETTELVLDNLLSLAELDTHVEWILGYIAQSHPALVWEFLGRRVGDDDRELERPDRYEAIPYHFYELPRVLSQDAASAVRVVRTLYSREDTLFEFRGGRLLSAMFPDFPDHLATELSALAADGSDDDLDFILKVLRAYRGQPKTQPVVMEVVARLPEGDRRLAIAEICLQSTGVVSGEFGLVGAYRDRKTNVEPWLNDPRPTVRQFAEQFIRHMDQSIAAEQRRAEERKQMRRLQFDEPEVK